MYVRVRADSFVTVDARVVLAKIKGITLLPRPDSRRVGIHRRRSPAGVEPRLTVAMLGELLTMRPAYLRCITMELRHVWINRE